MDAFSNTNHLKCTGCFYVNPAQVIVRQCKHGCLLRGTDSGALYVAPAWVLFMWHQHRGLLHNTSMVVCFMASVCALCLAPAWVLFMWHQQELMLTHIYDADMLMWLKSSLWNHFVWGSISMSSHLCYIIPLRKTVKLGKFMLDFIEWILYCCSFFAGNLILQAWFYIISWTVGGREWF